MNTRRHLQPIPTASDGPGRHGHGDSRRRPHGLHWLALGSLVALALVSMVTLSTAPTMHVDMVLVRTPDETSQATSPHTEQTTPSRKDPSVDITPPHTEEITPPHKEETLETPPPRKKETTPTSKDPTLITIPPHNEMNLEAFPQTKDTTLEVEKRELTKLRRRVAAVAETVARLSLRTTHPRGIVLPLFDGIATLGISLILELRAMDVDLPIEVPHCGDLEEAYYEHLLQQDHRVRVYDVCLEASIQTVDRYPKRKLFCTSLADCHGRFRDFDIKIISLLLSRFDEVMMLDADTLFFQTPMRAWQSSKYEQTGTLFFHDRISQDHQFLSVPRKRANDQTVSHLQEYLSNFDPVPFRNFGFVPRPKAVTPLGPWVGKQAPVTLQFEPSEFLLQSHSWNRRAGHEADSSLMLWNKKKQQRATAILGSFIARVDVGRPPSYGDKEFYFIACELAESDYAFSDFGIGSFGVDVHDAETPGKSVLCGEALHYLPDDAGVGDQPLLFMNSDRILDYKLTDNFFRSRARPASLFPGKIEDHKLAQECPFDVTVETITLREKELIARRQKFHETALSWVPSRVKAPTIPSKPPVRVPTIASPPPKARIRRNAL